MEEWVGRAKLVAHQPTPPPPQPDLTRRDDEIQYNDLIEWLTHAMLSEMITRTDRGEDLRAATRRTALGIGDLLRTPAQHRTHTKVVRYILELVEHCQPIHQSFPPTTPNTTTPKLTQRRTDKPPTEHQKHIDEIRRIIGINKTKHRPSSTS